MDTSSRRAFLETLLEDESATPRDKLKASELLAELDRRAALPQRTHEDTRADFAEYYATNPDKLARLIELADEHLFGSLPAYRERIERRASELIAEERAELREAMRRVNLTTAEEPEEQEPTGGPVRTRGARERG